jgi:hypothetical protein
MRLSEALDIALFVITIMSISFLSPSAIRGITAMSNSTTPFGPSGVIEFFSGIGPYVGLLVSGLLLLYRHLRDRNWKKKYKDVIVTKPLP